MFIVVFCVKTGVRSAIAYFRSCRVSFRRRRRCVNDKTRSFARTIRFSHNISDSPEWAWTQHTHTVLGPPQGVQNLSRQGAPWDNLLAWVVASPDIELGQLGEEHVLQGAVPSRDAKEPRDRNGDPEIRDSVPHDVGHADCCHTANLVSVFGQGLGCEDAFFSNRQTSLHIAMFISRGWVSWVLICFNYLSIAEETLPNNVGSDW